jgi:hypothetical protein
MIESEIIFYSRFIVWPGSFEVTSCASAHAHLKHTTNQEDTHSGHILPFRLPGYVSLQKMMMPFLPIDTI